jgi:hypothetical protein
MTEIYGPQCTALGDCWAFVSWLARKSVAEKRELVFSDRVIHLAGVANPPSARSKLLEIMAEMDLGEARLRMVQMMPTLGLPIRVQDHPGPYVPTKRRWSPGRRGRISLHLSNGQLPENSLRSIPLRDHVELMAFLGTLEMDLEVLGGHRPLSECVGVMARSDLFVGIDSGMSHVCHSVGTPMLLYKWRGGDRLDCYHPGKSFERFGTVGEARAIAARMLS